MRQLGDMYHLNKRRNESEAQYLRAKSIYAHQFPPNCLFAILLASLADLYQEMKRYSESEANYIQAVSIYTTRFPRNPNFANCLYSFGEFLEVTGRKTEAVEILQAALQIFQHSNDQSGAERCRAAVQHLAK